MHTLCAQLSLCIYSIGLSVFSVPFSFSGNPQIYNNQARFEPHNHGNQGMASGPMMGHMGMQNIIHGNGYVVYPPDGTTCKYPPREVGTADLQ